MADTLTPKEAIEEIRKHQDSFRRDEIGEAALINGIASILSRVGEEDGARGHVPELCLHESDERCARCSEPPQESVEEVKKAQDAVDHLRGQFPYEMKNCCAYAFNTIRAVLGKYGRKG